MNVNTYILMWDCNGLESVINATEEDQNQLMSILADRPVRSRNVGEILHYMTMRARFNSQRHYEIYAIDVEDGITTADIFSQFNDHPQAMADLIRERGRQLYSDRADPNRIKIV